MASKTTELQGYGTFTPSTPTIIPASSTSQTNAASSPSPTFDYYQIVGDSIVGYTAAEVDNAPFYDLCPGGDCFQSCQDFNQLFNTDYYAYNATAEFPIVFYNDTITLFGLCTNIASITSAISDTDILPNAEAYFNTQKTSRTEVERVVSGTAQCFYGTCQATRKPKECGPFCSPFVLEESISTLDIDNTYNCIAKLCDNTCGLPYANQDVFGVGVLVSCAIQAFIILLYAAFCIVRVPPKEWQVTVARPLTTSQRSGNVIHRIVRRVDNAAERINTAAGEFLVAQCFFAVSAGVAAFRLAPWNIDPLNGYALLFIATLGFIPPVFTLMLLRSQQRREWYHIFLVLLSWTLSTILFFMLKSNLQDVSNNSQRVAQARNNLFQVDACGGYSAMSLCTETDRVDPINYMMGFFNKDTYPNINNVFLIWLFPSLVVLALIVQRFFPRRVLGLLSNIEDKIKSKYTNRYTTTSHMLRRSSLTAAILLFVLLFWYQILMVRKYIEMDLIDTSRESGWTFGQLVAVLIWAPFLFELTIGWLLEWAKGRRDEKRLHQSHGHGGQTTTAHSFQGSTSSLYHAIPSSSTQIPLLPTSIAATPIIPWTPPLGNQGSTSPIISRPTTPTTGSAPPLLAHSPPSSIRSRPTTPVTQSIPSFVNQASTMPAVTTTNKILISPTGDPSGQSQIPLHG